MERNFPRRKVLSLIALGLMAKDLGHQTTAYSQVRLPFAISGPPRLPETARFIQTDGSACTISIEEYLKGVIPTEMSASWASKAIEALKAQAIAARTVAAWEVAVFGAITANRVQAWDVNRRDSRTDGAVDATKRQLLTYKGQMFKTEFFSSCGGQTTLSSDDPVPMQPVRCWRERTPLDLSTEGAASAFWGSPTAGPSFCSPANTDNLNTRYRYTWSVNRSDLEPVVSGALEQNADNVAPRYTTGQLGQLRDMVALNRDKSGAITTLRILGTGGRWDISGWRGVAQALGYFSPTNRVYSTTVVFATERSGETLIKINGRGGGWGHGRGMCQYGAYGMAKAGYDYRTILSHYYSGTEIVDLSNQAIQQFSRGYKVFLPFAERASKGCIS